jgi:hypothetical protein
MSRIFLIGLIFCALASPAHAEGDDLDCRPLYASEVQQLMKFSKKQTTASMIAVGPLALLFLSAATSSGESIVFEGPGAIVVGILAGVAVGVPGTIYLVKKFKSRHYREVLDNIVEAASYLRQDPLKYKRLRKLSRQIDKEHRFSLEELAQAVLDASVSGELCPSGKLLVTDDFRATVSAHLIP